jgi:hypothetical protein
VFTKVDLTVEGKKMLENFLLGVCGFTGTFRLADRLDKCIQAIKQVPFKSCFSFFRIRIQLGQRIQIGNPDPNPGRAKIVLQKSKNQ